MPMLKNFYSKKIYIKRMNIKFNKKNKLKENEIVKKANLRKDPR